MNGSFEQLACPLIACLSWPCLKGAAKPSDEISRQHKDSQDVLKSFTPTFLNIKSGNTAFYRINIQSTARCISSVLGLPETGDVHDEVQSENGEGLRDGER